MPGKCGGKLRRSEQKWGAPRFCGNAAGFKTTHVGSGRCFLHGGRSRKGVTHPRFVHGRESVVFQNAPSLHSRFEAALGNPQLADLRHKLAVTEALLREATDRLRDEGHDWPAWQKANAAMRAFRVAQRSGTAGVKAAGDALAELERLLTEGAGQEAGRDRVLRLVEQQRRVVETMQRRQDGNVPIEVVYAILRAASVAFLEVVSDTALRARFMDRMREVVGRGHAAVITQAAGE